LVTFSGTAPIEVATLAINGVAQQVVWTAVTTWQVALALSPGPQTVTIQGLDANAQPVAGMSATLNLQINVPPATPETNVIINEIMYHAAAPGAEYIELHNRSTTTAFDLSGWRLNGLEFTFAQGNSIAPG